MFKVGKSCFLKKSLTLNKTADEVGECERIDSIIVSWEQEYL